MYSATLLRRERCLVADSSISMVGSTVSRQMRQVTGFCTGAVAAAAEAHPAPALLLLRVAVSPAVGTSSVASISISAEDEVAVVSGEACSLRPTTTAVAQMADPLHSKCCSCGCGLGGDARSSGPAGTGGS